MTVAVMTSLAGWRDRHAGETIVVCGCGRSLHDLPRPLPFTTIGVNDVGRLFDPTYLVVLNPKSQFAPDRFAHVVRSRAAAIFTQLDLRAMGVAHPEIVRFRLGRRAGTDLTQPDTLPYTRNSPYVAVCLAAFMGAARIGVIGVDFTDHHFFAADGRHPLTAELATIDGEYAALAAMLARRGVELVNLSRDSRLRALPKAEVHAFLAGADAPPAARPAGPAALSIVSYATTPVAGVPAVLARCISARTPHRARCVWAERAYGNGVAFESDLEWRRDPRAAEEALAAADAVIVHNGKVDGRHQRLLDGKPVVTVAHNYAWNVDMRFVSRGLPGLVVGQYQATLPEFAGWGVVPNPIPHWEPSSTPDTKPGVVTICFTPSGRHERYPSGHRLYWHAKGYDTTLRALDALARRHALQLEVVRRAQVTHAESLAMKRRAHIVIDECVTGSYHRNSLEGLAAGCVVVNGVGLLPGVADAFRRCAPEAGDLPFTFSRLEDLEATLERLIAMGPEALAAAGAVNRAWFERHWDFAGQWDRAWLPAVSAAAERWRARPAAHAPVSSGRKTEMRRTITKSNVVRDETVSVVVPHGGAERLPQLTAVLASLRQRPAVGEVIVAEMGPAPAAAAVARRWADKYVFVETHEPFARGRALNVGSGVAECGLILWNDNDLLTGPDFVARAARELQERRLDYLIPYSTICYLSDVDSTEVAHGARGPLDCTPVSRLYSGRRQQSCSGGAGLVRRDFLLRYGGFIEGFVGWGGEDNAWNCKVALLGRTAPTRRRDQDAYHLFHASSAGYQGHRPGAHNPHYASNVALLGRVSRVRNAQQLLQQFPPVPRPCPWNPNRAIVLLAPEDAGGGAAAVAEALRTLYGAHADAAVVSTANGWHDRVAAADAVVVFGEETAARVRGDDGSAARRSLVVLDGAVAAPERCAVSLVGPLSLALAGVDPAPIADRRDPSLPVWVYWEGPCPEWIQTCRATIAAHGSDVRMLTPESFDALRDRDRDIDLSRLQPPQRADFIRAFLLARYGGLWIDSDCVVMQPLAPVLDLLRDHEFVAHRERSGLPSNGFIGARPGSRCARDFYDRICAVLRARHPIGWTTLGSTPLAETLNACADGWYELPCATVQPICWSNPGAFFVRGRRDAHAARFDPTAVCYMLSNTQIKRHADPARLLDADTFFRFLVDTSLGSNRDAGEPAPPSVTPGPADAPLRGSFEGFVDAYRRYGDESLSGPGSSLAQTAELRERLPLLVAALDVRTLVDAPCGDFNWMRHTRLNLSEYVGVDFLATLVAENQRGYGSPQRRFVELDLRRDPLPHADAILCRDCLVHLSFADVLAVLRNFKRSGATYLLTTTFTSARPNVDTADGEWRTLNLELPPFEFPKPLRLINERCTEAGGAYWDKSLGVWRLSDLPV